MAPIDINNQEISSVELNGNEINEITVDGQTVFTAQTLPVAYSNLVAWYPFDSATYGGSNADDVTAIIGGSGDDTAFDGTVSGATFQSTGGVTDINAGANSGAYEFTSSGDIIEFTGTDGVLTNQPATIMGWSFARDDNLSLIFGANDYQSSQAGFSIGYNSGDFLIELKDPNSTGTQMQTGNPNLNNWQHVAATADNNTLRLYIDGSLLTSQSITTNQTTFDQNLSVGSGAEDSNNRSLDGFIDDCRYYNTDLTGSQINQIYQNTEP